MKAEEFCKTVYPRATIERQRTNRGETYYLIRACRGATMHISDGNTKSAAWVKLRKRIEEKQ